MASLALVFAQGAVGYARRRGGVDLPLEVRHLSEPHAGLGSQFTDSHGGFLHAVGRLRFDAVYLLNGLVGLLACGGLFHCDGGGASHLLSCALAHLDDLAKAWLDWRNRSVGSPLHPTHCFVR